MTANMRTEKKELKKENYRLLKKNEWEFRKNKLVFLRKIFSQPFLK
jgi:hypothetical protein